MDADKEPPSKIYMDTGATDIPPDDTEGERKVGFWHQLARPVLYPAGSSLCTRCSAVLMDIQ